MENRPCVICKTTVLGGNIHDSCQRAASPSPAQVIKWGSHAEWEKLTTLPAAALLKLLKHTADWVSTHMVIDMRKCFLCADPTYKIYNCLPLCAECFSRMNPAKEIKTDDVRATIDAVYATSTQKRPSHREVCSNRKIRHSYLIKTPPGYLQYDGTLEPEMHKANRWTRAEMEIESARFQDIGTPLTITRVIR